MNQDIAAYILGILQNATIVGSGAAKHVSAINAMQKAIDDSVARPYVDDAVESVLSQAQKTIQKRDDELLRLRAELEEKNAQIAALSDSLNKTTPVEQ